MTRRPKLKATLSRKDFRDKIAEMANDFARHIELNVEAFAADPAAGKLKARQCSACHGKDGRTVALEMGLFDSFPAILNGTVGP